ncbi:MAG: cyclic nucleotide-binding domain-containing protein [Gammaproteobacteria bacterium]|nr:cyclic nucleotide-binding domain-containing protein [Gammaproteobacteria bacterium]
MSDLNWKMCLEQHPVFSELSQEDIAQILDDNVSVEKIVEAGQTIVKQGDIDQSIYLIGQGAADVYLTSNNQKVFLNNLGKGDLIGEMALFEQKKRSASVIASEQSILLEFKGNEFIKLLKTRPEICFKLLIKFSERLRNLGQDVLTARLKDVDDKINHVNAKLDTEIKIIDASLKATQTVFDQTSKRAHEVIESADRSRSRFTVAASTVGTIFTLLLSALSYMGYSKVQNVSAITESVEEKSEKLEQLSSKAIMDIESIKQAREQMDDLRLKLNNTDQHMNDFYIKSMIPQFFSELDSDIEKARQTYRIILSIDDSKVSDALYRQILVELLSADAQRRDILAETLNTDLDDSNQSLSERQRTLSFYLRLCAFILNGNNTQFDKEYKRFENTISSFSKDEIKKQMAEVDLGPQVFAEFLNQDTGSGKGSNKDKLEKIQLIWQIIP